MNAVWVGRVFGKCFAPTRREISRLDMIIAATPVDWAKRKGVAVYERRHRFRLYLNRLFFKGGANSRNASGIGINRVSFFCLTLVEALFKSKQEKSDKPYSSN